MDVREYKTYYERSRDEDREREEQRQHDRAEYAFKQYMMGKDYDDAWDRWEERQ